jgi:hypothetical protein
MRIHSICAALMFSFGFYALCLQFSQVAPEVQVRAGMTLHYHILTHNGMCAARNGMQQQCAIAEILSMLPLRRFLRPLDCCRGAPIDLDMCMPLQNLITTMFGIYTARGHEELSKVTTATALV